MFQAEYHIVQSAADLNLSHFDKDPARLSPAAPAGVIKVTHATELGLVNSETCPRETASTQRQHPSDLNVPPCNHSASKRTQTLKR